MIGDDHENPSRPTIFFVGRLEATRREQLYEQLKYNIFEEYYATDNVRSSRASYPERAGHNPRF